jgi:hypothetical protein
MIEGIDIGKNRERVNMLEHANTRSGKSSSAAVPASTHEQGSAAQKSLQDGDLTTRPLGPSLANILQMQRIVGNRAVQRMLSASSRADKPVVQRQVPPAPEAVAAPAGPVAVPPAAVPAEAAGPVSAAAPAAPAAPAAAPKNAKDLKNFSNYHVVYKWLKARAAKEKKNGLFGYFDDLSAGQKMQAIKAMCDNARFPSVEKAEETMLTGVYTKTVDWDRFSEICRDAKSKDTKNYNADEARDYVSYTAIGNGRRGFRRRDGKQHPGSRESLERRRRSRSSCGRAEWAVIHVANL